MIDVLEIFVEAQRDDASRRYARESDYLHFCHVRFKERQRAAEKKCLSKPANKAKRAARQKEYFAKWYAANREQVLAKRRARRAKK